MAELVPCIVFPCRKCGLPIMLPLDDFERLVPSQGEPPDDDRAVILVCEPCKYANIYSPRRNSPYYIGMERRECLRIGVPDRVYTPQCAGKMNEFQAPLVVTWIGEPTEADKQRRSETWIGGHLRCSAGHAIPWPWRQTEKG